MNEPFTHSPLNHKKPSIRLVQILRPLSSKGLIQCRVWHTVMTTTYSCVSYRWGDPDPTCEIEINGESFAVRQNLFNFLSIVREDASRDASPEAYWIDAICIDQTDILERNHQVAQMGQIFSNATSVHIWLGSVPSALVGVMRTIRRDNGNPSSMDWNEVHLQSNLYLINKYVINNRYFRRAWVTQEVLLARNVTVRLGGHRGAKAIWVSLQ